MIQAQTWVVVGKTSLNKQEVSNDSPMNDPLTARNVVDSVVDSVAESPGKIVVTTTISLDHDAVGSRAPFLKMTSGRSETTVTGGDPGSYGEDTQSLQRLQQAVSEGKITMLQLAPKTYLGFVNGRNVKAHPLFISDTLFIFVSRHNSLTGMAELIAELMRQLPPGASWNGENRSEQIEHITQLLSGS
jgi:hypothetical protein